MKTLKGFRAWSIIYPVFLYWAVVVVVMMMAQMVLGQDDAHYMLCQIIASLVALLVTYIQFFRFDKKDRVVKEFTRGKLMVTVALLVVGCVSLGVALNDIILMSPLVNWSKNFQAANNDFYGGPLVWQILGAGIIVPITEELIYRGVIFQRLRGMMKFVPAMLISALVFAVLHFNLVQFIYALLCGFALAFVVEITERVWVSMLCHMAMNMLALLRTEFGWGNGLIESSVSSWLINVGLLLVGVGLIMAATGKKKGTVA